jgi:hypothetical protein
MKRVRLPALNDRERALIDEVHDMERVVTPTDWFLKHCIDTKRKEVSNLYTTRVAEQSQRYAAWKYTAFKIRY